MAFAIEYLVFVVFCLFAMTNIAISMLPKVWRNAFPEQYEYGTCNGRPARRGMKYGNVQFVLWKAGEQGCSTDIWHDFDSSWWPQFIGLTPSCALGNISVQYHLTKT